MIIKKNFNRNYEAHLDSSISLNDRKGVEEHLMRCAGDVVDTLQQAHKNAWFKIMVMLNPNPSNCKGVNQVKIEIWQTEDYQDENFKPFVRHSAKGYGIGECVQNINKDIDNLIGPTDDIVELNGKKYKLVEVK